MKIGIASDFHLGYNEDALPQAREALRKASQSADVLLLPGDLFDIRVPRQETIHEAIELFNEARGLMAERMAGVRMTRIDAEGNVAELAPNPLLAIYGTHERRSKGMTNVIQLLEAAGVLLNIHACSIVVEKNGEKVAFYGMGGVPEEFAPAAVQALDPKPVPDAFNIFSFHQSLKELIPVDDCLSMEDLPAGFDLYVNGHIHWRRDLQKEGKRCLIPGSTVITQMKEIEQQPKGFWLYDTLKKDADFIDVPTRPFYYIDLSFENAAAKEILRAAREKLEALAAIQNAQEPLVKMKLRGTLGKGVKSSHIDTAQLEESFRGKLRVSIDKEFDSDELKEQIEKVRRQRENAPDARELGLDLLRLKLRAASMPMNAEELFELLAEGELESVLKSLEASVPAQQ